MTGTCNNADCCPGGSPVCAPPGGVCPG
jgi:hypothetical protein